MLAQSRTLRGIEGRGERSEVTTRGCKLNVCYKRYVALDLI